VKSVHNDQPVQVNLKLIHVSLHPSTIKSHVVEIHPGVYRPRIGTTKVSVRIDGSYSIVFTLPTPDDYLLVVKLGNILVRGNLFSLKTSDASIRVMKGDSLAETQLNLFSNNHSART